MVRGRRDRGQSTVEYLLVVVAVLLAVMFGVRKVLQGKVEDQMKNAGAIVDKAGTELKTATGIP